MLHIYTRSCDTIIREALEIYGSTSIILMSCAHRVIQNNDPSRGPLANFCNETLRAIVGRFRTVDTEQVKLIKN